MWDQVSAPHTTCFRLCRPAACYVKGPSGWFPSWPLQREEKPPSLRQRDLGPHQGGFLLSPMKTLSAGSWWVTLWAIFRASRRCPSLAARSPEAPVYLGLHLLCCTVETESAGCWGQSWGVSTEPLSPCSHFFPYSPPVPSPRRWGCSSSWVRWR